MVFDRADKILWHSTISFKEEQNIIDKILVEKIIWYIDNTQNFKLSLKKKDFVTFVEFFDKEEKLSREKLIKIAIQKTTKITPVEEIMQKEQTDIKQEQNKKQSNIIQKLIKKNC